ncbi:hypothetical protein ACJRO7_022905 [Eucalyptus globulus]|uniref:Pentatricopeptide repeat-containing protein n=1 Tax=Eucalyptus globulus TaxID=34317 RepID=A0ABD3KCX9_EUCGL
MYSVFRKAMSARLVFDAGIVLDLVSWNSMTDDHVKNGEVDARWLFDRMPFRDIASWNCMTDGCARIDNVSEACSFFDSMPLQTSFHGITLWALHVRVKDYIEEIKANRATLASVLTACANTGDLNTGQLVYSYMKDNNIEADMLLSTALVTMYAKCGTMDLAMKVFDQMPDRNVNAPEMILELEKRGPMPNCCKSAILSACTRSRMVLEGWWCFNMMSRVNNIQPKVEHYGCMVDLLTQAGLVKDSGELIKEVTTEAGFSLWGALLSACRTHSHIKLGEMVGGPAFDQVGTNRCWALRATVKHVCSRR